MCVPDIGNSHLVKRESTQPRFPTALAGTSGSTPPLSRRRAHAHGGDDAGGLHRARQSRIKAAHYASSCDCPSACWPLDHALDDQAGRPYTSEPLLGFSSTRCTGSSARLATTSTTASTARPASTDGAALRRTHARRPTQRRRRPRCSRSAGGMWTRITAAGDAEDWE